MSELIEKLSHASPVAQALWLAVFSYVIVLSVQTVLYLVKKKEKDRARFIVITFMVLAYNISTLLFIENKININNTLKVLLTYAFPLLAAYYITYYCYKLLQVKKLYDSLIIAPLLFLIIPYVFSFVWLFLRTNNELLAGKHLVIVPGGYAIFLIGKLIITIKNESTNYWKKVKYFNLKVTLCIIAILSFLGLAIAQFFNNAIIEILLVNIGFSAMLFVSFLIEILNLKKENEKLNQLENTVQEYEEKLEQNILKRTWKSNALKEQTTNNFINLTHEVRTPLTLINCYLDEYILKNRASKEINIIKESITKLNRIINNFLDTETFRKKLTVFKNEQITDFSATLNSILVLFKQYASKKDIKMINNIEKNIFVKAAPEAIELIINNLLDNAIKYSPDKGTINTKLTTSNGKVLFSVKDKGKGIPEEKQTDIFKPRVQLSSNNSNKQGMGMGLTLVLSTVNSLKGNINLTSEEGQGSEFIIELNEYKVTNGEELKNEIENTREEADFNPELLDSITDKNYTVLIVEDNTTLLAYLRSKLADNYNVYLAKNGVEALKKISNAKYLPDIIISDIMMEKMDGFELLKNLSGNLKYTHIPFILLTAKTSDKDRIKGIKSGAIDYISKPFRIDEVLEKINTIIKKTEKQKKVFISNIYETVANNMGSPTNNVEPNQNTFKKYCTDFGFTKTEIKVIEALKQYFDLKFDEIADLLFMSTRTFEKHVQNMYKKTGVTNKKDLIELLFL